MPAYTQIVIGLGLAVVLAAISFRARFLTAGGARAQAILGWLIFGFGGWSFAVPVLVFFFSSSLLSQLPSRPSATTEQITARGSIRDAVQVLANRSAAGLAVLGSMFLRSDLWYIAYAGSLAAATADTWGTEIGIRSGASPRLLASFRPVEPGRSGGVTLPGTFGGFCGAIIIGMSALAWLPSDIFAALGSIVAGGLAGSIVDSLLGSTAQARFHCVVCGKITERTCHCGAETAISGGISWLNNDLVNLACTASGFAAAPALYMLLR